MQDMMKLLEIGERFVNDLVCPISCHIIFLFLIQRKLPSSTQWDVLGVYDGAHPVGNLIACLTRHPNIHHGEFRHWPGY